MAGRYLRLALLAAIIVACDDDDDDGTGPSPVTEEFTATLTGANERPTPVVTPATGSADFTLSGDTLYFTIVVDSLSSPATAAHIHGPSGIDGVAGPILGFTLADTLITTGTLASGFATAPTDPSVSQDSLLVLMRNGNAYVNVHTATNPDGEIRGQVVRNP
ncbi:MAG TPA: CHRD domain-containing protein [Gemmatimonadaceae bacterium]|nr:CHRD domain-containing protein [Gemmatimonadaceae bacterium]